MAPTALTRDEEVALRQIEGIAHMGLDNGDGLAGTATATQTASGYTVDVALAPQEQPRRDYWLAQVESEFFIARTTRLLNVTVKVATA